MKVTELKQNKVIRNDKKAEQAADIRLSRI